MDNNIEPSQSETQLIAQEFNMSKSELISIKIAMLIFSALFFVGITIPFWPTSEKDISAYLILLFIAGLWSLITGVLYSFYRMACHSDIVIDEDGLWYKEKDKTTGLVPWNQIFKVRVTRNFSFVLAENNQRLIRIHHSLQNYANLNKILKQTIKCNIARREAQDTRVTREFYVNKKVISEKRIFFLLYFSFSAVLIALLSYQYSQRNINDLSTTAIMILYICYYATWGLPMAGFSIAAILFGLKSKRLPYANIVLDEDGLWHEHMAKANGLIPWSKIHHLKEGRFQQCLDILDFNGCKVMRAEYELDKFVVLRDRLLNKVAHNNQLELADCFGSNILRPLAYGSILALIFLAGYIGGNLNPDTSLSVHLGALACAIVLIGMYLFSISRVSVQGNKFFFKRPVKTETVDFSNIKSYELVDSYDQGIRGSSVQLTTYDDKVYDLSAYACVDAHILYLALKKVFEAYRSHSDGKQ